MAPSIDVAAARIVVNSIVKRRKKKRAAKKRKKEKGIRIEKLVRRLRGRKIKRLWGEGNERHTVV